jgi:hypothetical protein
VTNKSPATSEVVRKLRAGSEYQYTAPIKYANEAFPGTYAFAFLLYVVDGGNPIPFVGKDLIALVDVDVTDRNTPVIIDTPLQLKKVGAGGP